MLAARSRTSSVMSCSLTASAIVTGSVSTNQVDGDEAHAEAGEAHGEQPRPCIAQTTEAWRWFGVRV